MAEFGVQATELAAPQGAGANVLAPVQGVAEKPSALPGLIQDLGSIFTDYRKESNKQTAEEYKNAYVGEYISRQNAINEAVRLGEMDATRAGTESRALFGKFMGNAAYASDIFNAYKGMAAGSELSQVEDAEKREKDFQKEREASALRDGVVVPKWASKELREQTLSNYENTKRIFEDFQKQAAREEEDRKKGRYRNEIDDRVRKEESVANLNKIAGNALNRLPVFSSELRAQVASGKMSQEEAEATWAKEVASIRGGMTAAAQLDPTLANSYEELLTGLDTYTQKWLNPKTRTEATQNEFDALMTKSKLAVVIKDPKVRGMAVARSLLGDNVLLQMASVGSGTESVIAIVTGMETEGQPLPANTPPVVGTESQEGVMKFLNGALNNYGSGKYDKDPKAIKEIRNGVNTVIKQVGEQYKLGKLDSTKLRDFGNLASNPMYAKMVKDGMIDAEANQVFAEALRKNYEPLVLNKISQSLDTWEKKLQGTSGVSSITLGDAVDIQMDSTGNLSFVATPLPKATRTGLFIDADRDTQRVQNEMMNDLKSSSAALSHLVKAGAHMAGRTDYQQYWQENRHVWYPNIYVPAGTVSGGYVSPNGGRLKDPSTWKPVKKETGK